MTFLQYLIQVNLYLVLFYGFYRLLLANETFYTLNRIYLVGSAVLSFGIPFWYSDYVQSFFITQQVNAVFYTVLSPAVFGAKATAENPFTWYDLLKVFYGVCTLFLSIKLIFNFLQLKRILENTEGHAKHGAGFSFFNFVFVDKDLQKHEVVMEHEYVHIKQLHSADVILFEVIAVLCWFNPVVYFYKKSVKHIHEFIADDIASRLEASKADYAMLLFSQQFGLNPHQLTNQFIDKSTLKRRIEMLHKPRSRKIALLKYGFTAPLFALMLVIASASIAKHPSIDKVENIFETTKHAPILDSPIAWSKENVFSDSLITGKVISAEDGTPLIGVFVYIQGKGDFTATDKEGNYKIKATFKDELTFMNAGFELNTVPVTDKKIINVSLNVGSYVGTPTDNVVVSDNNSTQEVVIVGYSKNGKVHSEEIFTTVDENPTFQGGTKEMYKYIGQNLRYPVEAQKRNTQGKVFAKFIVRKDGSVSDIEILKGIGSGCDEEVIRVINSMPKWNPGKKNGVPVNAYFTMPVSFVLEGGNENKYTKESFTVIENGVTKTYTETEDIKREYERVKVISRDKSKSVDMEESGDGKIVTVTIHNKSSTNENGLNTFGRPNLSNVNGEPLFVIDGKTVVKDEMLSLKPEEILTVEVLKNTSATAIYGEKGKNGVVVITTKKTAQAREESNFTIKGKQLYTIKIGNKRQIIDAKTANDYSTDRIMQVNVIKVGEIKTRKTSLNEYEQKVLNEGYDGWVDIWIREQ